jgi:hypothetical protein
MILKFGLRNIDVFGYPVGLHFGRWQSKEKGRSQKYKTEIGGFMTIIYIILLTVAISFYIN